MPKKTVINARTLKTPKKGFTKKERETLIKMLTELENHAYYPLHGLSGAFADAEIYSHDEDEILVELKFGVQNDCENRVDTEEYRINRETMEWEK